MNVHRLLQKVLAASVATMAIVGASQASDRVVGGTESKPGTWPFMAYLLIDGAWQCGGTLVAKNVVLTAAHCTRDVQSGVPFAAGAYTVRLGSTDSDSGGTLRMVKRVVVHERYDPKTSENDIAILELDQPVDLPTVALAGRQPQTRGMVRYSRVSTDAPFGAVVGWGRTDASVQDSASHNLMEAPIPIVEASACNSVMGGTERGPIDERRICAGLSQGGVDACNGDSGGPLLAPGQDDRWVEVGVTSWGVSRCGDPHTYGVYTRVSAYADWLARNIGDAQAMASVPNSASKEESGSLSKAPTVMAVAAREDGHVRIKVCPGTKCPDRGEADQARALKVGEIFTIQVQADTDGYLLLLDVGSDGKITQLFPNARSAAANATGFIKAGSPLTLPDASYGFEFRASEPLGRGRLIAVVAQKQQMLAGLAEAQNGFAQLPQTHLNRLEAVLKPKLSVVGVSSGATSAPAPKPIPTPTQVPVPTPAVVAGTSASAPPVSAPVAPSALPISQAPVQNGVQNAKPAAAAVTNPVVPKPTAPKPVAAVSAVASAPAIATGPAVAAPPAVIVEKPVAAKPVLVASAPKPVVTQSVNPAEKPVAAKPVKPAPAVPPPAVPAQVAPQGWGAGQRDYIVVAR